MAGRWQSDVILGSDNDHMRKSVDGYAAARRLIIAVQSFFTGLAAQLSVGVWLLTLVVVLATLLIGLMTWRKGGWSYRRTLEIWKRNPMAARRDLKLMGPLISLIHRHRPVVREN